MLVSTSISLRYNTIMFWADRIAKQIIDSNQHKPYWVDDMKTPSGFAHIGSVLGPVIHSCIYRALKDAKKDATFTYVFNDFDPADEFPAILKDALDGHKGKPLKMVPSPDVKFQNLADYLADDLKKSLAYVGFEAKYISSWEMYHQGKFDEVIRIALDNSEKIQEIYQKVSGSRKKEAGWLPFQTICEQCGKLGTTKVFEWDGEKVSYRCEEKLVTWATGCGYTGKISPFGGKGKLPWKVDWPAHWKVLGVTIEAAGKDHASAGGSYDIAMALCKEVFDCPQPFKLPYEFILIGGKKMSSSKGIGLKAHDLMEILPAELARFLFVRSDIKSQSNFDPDGTLGIPVLFDEYQKAAEAHFHNGDADLARAFVLSQVKKDVKEPPKIRFSVLAQWVQMPNMEEEIKKEGLEEWAKYARIWVERFAPESEKFSVLKSVPESAKNLSENQKEFLKKVVKELDKKWIAEDLQKNLFEWAKEMGVSSKDAFAAIYTSLIGKDHGPKAGWFILSLDKEFVKKRFEEVASGEEKTTKTVAVQKLERPEFFSIDKKVKETFPSISVGAAIIKNVHIEKSNSALEKEKLDILKSLENLTTEQLGQYLEIISYRKLYKEMKVDWHSKRPSPEALLRRIALKKGLYTVNTCVDAYNLVVIKHRMSVGAFDLDALSMPSVLRFPNEGEKILLLGDEKETEYRETELGYFDTNGGYNIDFNYRDAQRTAVQATTKNLYINVDGIYDITPEKVELVLKEACDTIIKYCGGSLELFGVST